MNKRKKVGRPRKRGPKKKSVKVLAKEKMKEIMAEKKNMIMDKMNSKYLSVGKVVVESGIIDSIEEFIKSEDMVTTRTEIKTYKEVLSILDM